MARLADFSAGLPSPEALRQEGFDGALLYLSGPRDPWMAGKRVTREYTQSLRDAGLAIVSIWQFLKQDWERGFDGGVADGQTALGRHFEVGGKPFRPCYFAIDKDITRGQWDNLVLPYLMGAASVWGQEWVGPYGGQRTMRWAHDAGFRWLWQTLAWSRYEGDNWKGNAIPVQWDPRATIRQERIDDDIVGGIGVDVNTTWTLDYGQWNLGGDMAGPQYTELNRMGNSRSSRHGARITNPLWHTEEGNGSAESLASYCNNSNNGVSYHYTIRDGIVCDVVDTDFASWSVLDANSRTLNYCFAGSRANWSRDEWLRREGDIRIAVWITLQDCRKYGVSMDLIGRDYSRQRDGISDHYYVTKVLGIGTHTDVGKDFPWDRAKAFLDEYLGVAVVPAPNLIDAEAERAASWIGARHTVGENPLPGGTWAEFDNGYIYWSPSTGAKAIPNHLFEAWAEYGFEAGFLGYPVTDHTVLLDPEGKPWGDVQSFQNGTLYRKYGEGHGYYIHGYIGARWARSGFENGPFGWPTSNETGNETQRVQNFERGYIVWSADGTMMLSPQDGPDQLVHTIH